MIAMIAEPFFFLSDRRDRSDHMETRLKIVWLKIVCAI